MARTILIDSGGIVAALHRRDQHHAWARAHFESFVAPCLTCEAVLSESFFLLQRARQATDALCALLERKIVSVEYSLRAELAATLRLLRRYANVPMSFADACLVRMAEVFDDVAVFTTDSDFEIYRKHGRQVIPLITPY
jgi:Predicted nucleic acid-binding protein, contains PIN domain